jgi:signal transduction histidine kinase
VPRRQRNRADGRREGEETWRQAVASPEDKLKEVFEPFFTSKAEGMGMGLSIARTIIEVHNGLIWAKNQDHGGATFRIKLPLVQ